MRQDQALATGLRRWRTTSVAAPMPNNMTIDGSGTSVPLLVPFEEVALPEVVFP